ncbi:MAG TPA: hypothetical protein VLE44_00925 [Candidatus Saccharimonadales bacterium]|nr:hypothetical protein [Candidatus Saccharimonadales bacterium]
MLPEDLRSKLKVKLLQEKGKLQKKHAHAVKYLKTKNFDLSKVREHSAKAISAGALATALLLSPPIVKNLPPSDVTDKNKVVSGVNVSLETPQERLLTSIKSILPSAVRPLTPEEEKKLETVFNSTIGVPSKANLEGEHLNTTYGLIGAEQHLRRYPGDVMGVTHPALEAKDEGMAPGLGAWGYFASSKDKLTPDLVEKEKWYAVVQTLYLPDWQKRLPYLREWYKYRKVLIVNTTNGNAVVADVADSGPAAFTGKVFGGSPEVMNYLGGTNYKKGPVVLFFVDDPNNKIPLGPVEYNKIVEDLAGLNVQAL